MMAMKDFSLKQHIIENTLAGNSKGGIFECAVADALHKKGYQLYFYKNETTKKEIDVIIQKDGKVVPIEVKSGNTRANSLKSIMKNNKDISYEVYSELLPADKVEKVEELIQIKSEKENMICVFQYNSEASCC